MPIYTVDLDLPPRERFKETAIVFKEHYFVIERLYMGYLTPVMRAVIHMFADVFWIVHPTYWEEIKGMAEAIEGKETLVLLIQYVYELSAFCTSTIAYDSTGLIHHGRNLDYPFPQLMRNLAYEAHFIKDKRILYKAVMFGVTNGVSVG